jgi:hypothetical protein
MMLGVLPGVNNKEQWVTKITKERARFASLEEKVSSAC